MVEGSDATVELGSLDDWQYTQLHRVAFSPNCLIDGTFPDYRRVIQQCLKPCDGAVIVPGFNQGYVSSFCDIARELYAVTAAHQKERYFRGNLVITGATRGEAALISFPCSDIAFGLLMPMRVPSDFKPKAPYWFADKLPSAIAA